MRKAQWQRLGEKKGVFSGGYVDNTQNLYQGDNTSPFLRNARLDGNSIIIRPGHQLQSELTEGSYPKGIGAYNNTLIVRHNQDTTEKLVHINLEDDTITGIDTGSSITGNTRMQFTTIGNKIYCLDGVQEGIGIVSGTTYSLQDDNLYIMNISNISGTLEQLTTYQGAISGATIDIRQVSTSFLLVVLVGTPTLGETFNKTSGGASASFRYDTGGVFSPAFGVYFNSSFFVGGVSALPNAVFKSLGNSPENFRAIAGDVFTFDETITGLEATNEALFYFSETSISATSTNDISTTDGIVSYNTRRINAKEGAINHATIVSRGPDIFFVTPSLKIQRLRRGSNIEGFEVQDLSHREYAGIETIISTLDNDQSDSFGYYVADKNIIKWFFKRDGATFNDICIIYDLSKDAFLIDEQKYFFDGVSVNGKNYTVSMIEGKVYRDEYSQDDEGSSISFEYRTKEFYLSDPTYKKVLWESRTLIDINELATLTQSIYADGGEIDTKTIQGESGIGGVGAEVIGGEEVGVSEEEDTMQEVTILRTKGNLNTIGKKFQWRFTCDSIAGKIRLKDIQTLIEIKPPLSNNI